MSAPPPDALRRRFLRASAGTLLLPLLGTGLLAPRRVLAANWNRPAFTATQTGEAMKAYGAGNAVESREVLISAPEIAENGAKVDIEVTSNLPNTRGIALFIERNPMPLSAALDFGPNVLPFARLQVRLADTTRVRAVARTADGKHYTASREIKVTVGGCGG